MCSAGACATQLHLAQLRGAYRHEANPGAVALSIYSTDGNLMLFHGNPVSALRKNVNGRLPSILHLELHLSATLIQTKIPKK